MKPYCFKKYLVIKTTASPEGGAFLFLKKQSFRHSCHKSFFSLQYFFTKKLSMKKIISIYGRAAAGKTTQADLLADKYGFHQFGMGDRLREEIESESELGKKIKPFVDEGVLIPDELMEKVLGNVFVEAKNSGLMFDGFPRIIGQAKMMQNALTQSGSEFDVMFYLNVSTEEAIRRIQLRAEAGGREDDKNPEVVRTRLAVFDQESTAVLDFYRQHGKLIEIDGEKSIEEIFEIICTEIEK